MANADACDNFACKRPNIADVGGRGGGKKWQNFADPNISSKIVTLLIFIVNQTVLYGSKCQGIDENVKGSVFCKLIKA